MEKPRPSTFAAAGDKGDFVERVKVPRLDVF
jgi:hypothetical protein